MNKNNNFTVYMHIFPNSKKYIGITGKSPKQRWKNGKGYKNSILLNNAINKYGWQNIEHIIIAENLTQKQASDAEIYWIKYWDSTNKLNGYNLSSGGEKSSIGHKMTDKQRLKISVPIKQYDLSGKFIKEWISASSVERTLGFDHSTIAACCKNKNHTAYGFIWRYKNSKIPVLIPIKTNKKHKKMTKNTKSRGLKVLQYSISGNFIKEYDSVSVAAIKTNSDPSHIVSVCKHKVSQTNGYVWFYKKDKIFIDNDKNSTNVSKLIKKSIKSPNKHKKVAQYSLSGKYIRTWDSASCITKNKAFKSTNIHRTCQGLQSKAYGFIWKYVQDL